MEPHEFPQTGPGDVGHAVVRAVLQAIPFGSSAVELLNLVVVPPLERRRDEFIILIADGLNALAVQVQQLQPETLVHNERFISAFAYALPIAIRSHQKEKLEALRNAVLNTALPMAPDDDLQLMFLNYIDIFTPWHLRILTLLDNWKVQPAELRRSYGELPWLLEKVYPELQRRQAFCLQVLKDLGTHGLTAGDASHTAAIVVDGHPAIITDLGRHFLDFIKVPFEPRPPGAISP